MFPPVVVCNAPHLDYRSKSVIYLIFYSVIDKKTDAIIRSHRDCGDLLAIVLVNTFITWASKSSRDNLFTPFLLTFNRFDRPIYWWYDNFENRWIGLCLNLFKLYAWSDQAIFEKSRNKEKKIRKENISFYFYLVSNGCKDRASLMLDCSRQFTWFRGKTNRQVTFFCQM